MCSPSACSAGTRHEFASSPPISTEHAPHSPSPHPSFTPVSRNCSRRTSKSRAIGRTFNVRPTPFTLHRISAMLCFHHGLHKHFGRHRNAIHGHPGGVLDRV